MADSPATPPPAAPTDPAAPASPPAASADPGSPPAAANAGGEPAAAPGESLLAPAANDADWLPEKFRVNGEDGKLDEAASARKLAESYKALEAHKGPLPQVPAKPEDYKLEAPKGPDGKPVEGLDFEAFTADPLFQGFIADAHAQGMTNEQLQFVTDKYLQLAPDLFAANAAMSAQDAKAELGKLWTDEASMGKNLGAVTRAINGFGNEAEDMPGSKARLFAKYGTDPDFIAFAAKVAGEMAEDRLPSAGLPHSSDLEMLQKSEAYWNPQHPEHKATVARVNEINARQFGNARR